MLILPQIFDINVIALFNENVIIYVEGDDCMVMKEGTKTIIFRVDSKTKFSIEMVSHAENMLVNNWITNIIKIIEKSKSRKK